MMNRYNADGRKIQEKVISGSSVAQRDYLGIFIYENGELKKILFEGGYNNGTWYIIEGKSILLDEIISTHLENLFRSENNLPLRQRYSNGGPLIIDKNRGSIYYNNDNQTYFRRVKKSERYIY